MTQTDVAQRFAYKPAKSAAFLALESGTKASAETAERTLDAIATDVGHVDKGLDVTWLFEAWNETPNGGSSISKTSKYISGLEAFLQDRQFDRINDILRETREKYRDNMRSVTLVLFARATFLARDQIDEWKPYVDSVAEALKARGQDSGKVLQGLAQ